VCVALMEEQGFACLDRDGELPFEDLALNVARRIIAVVVQAGFPDRTNFRRARQLAKALVGRVVVLHGVVRMDARRGEQASGVGASKCERVLAAFVRCTRHHHAADPVGARPLQDVVKILAKGFVGEVGADVDQVHVFFRFEAEG